MHLKKLLAFCPTFVTALLIAASASGDLIVNGSFEANTAATTSYNLTNGIFNATVSGVTAFGGANELDIITFGGGFGTDPVDGNWHAGVHASTSGLEDAFSFDLNSSVSAGTSYNLSFWATANSSFDPGTEPLEIGISSNATSFGTLVFSTGMLPADTWTLFSTTFVAPTSGGFLTVRQSGAPTGTWVHVDGFRLSAIPEPATLGLLSVVSALVLIQRRNRV